MKRRPPRSTLDRSSAASDVYKRQVDLLVDVDALHGDARLPGGVERAPDPPLGRGLDAVSYTHLRAHETVLDLVCRLLLEKNTPDHLFLPLCHLYFFPIILYLASDTRVSTS